MESQGEAREIPGTSQEGARNSQGGAKNEPSDGWQSHALVIFVPSWAALGSYWGL